MNTTAGISNQGRPRRRAGISFLMVLCIWTATPATEHYNPVVKNFSKSEYRADSQNWAVAEDGYGNIYFANSKGLLEFDGVTWRLYPSPQILRCVAVDRQNRIYTGGFGELGYWERNDKGILRYFPLTPASKHFHPNIEFWHIIPAGDKIYFHSFRQVLILDRGHINAVALPSFSNAMFQVDEKIIVDQPDGLYSIENNGLKPYLREQFFNTKQIRFLFRDKLNRLIIGTSSQGVYVYDGHVFKILNTGWNDYFTRHQVNRALQSDNGELIIGTILDGIICFDKEGKFLFKLNTQNGLQNNTVLGIAFDRNMNIWQALDRGISVVTYRNTGSYAIHPVRDIGAVYTAAIFGNKFYLGTNQGLYSKNINEPDDRFVLVPQSQGQVWYCRIINSKLFIGHNNGTFVMTDDGLKKISGVSGASAITPDPKNPGLLLQSTYSDIVALDFTGDEPRWRMNMKNFNDLIQYIEVDIYGNVWAGHMHRGIYRLRLSDQRNEVVHSAYYGEDSPFRKDYGIHPFKIEERIVFATGDKFFTYDELKDTIVEYNSLNVQLGDLARAHRLFSAPGHHYWFVTDTQIGLFHIRDNLAKLIKVYPSSLFSNQLIENFENIIPLTMYEAVLCLENGYALLNANQPEGESHISNKGLLLKEFITTDRRGNSDTLQADSPAYTLGYHHNNALIKFSFPLFTRDKIVFRAFLEGIDPAWRTSVSLPVFKLDRLPKGEYKLHVKAIDSWGNESQIKTIKLEILPPWYLSIGAKITFGLLTLILLLLFRRRVISQTRRNEHRKREEKERELTLLKNEKLQDEISFKSQELANSTMSIIKKNEFLLELKRILRSQKSQLESRFPDKYYLHLIKKIDDNISSHDDWKTFESHFERAHEEFINKLKTGYPKLTPGDLRLCAYLRMNLSSKEIAHLLGISVRGVENHRYRLRKKMGLDIDVNLNEVMMNQNKQT